MSTGGAVLHVTNGDSTVETLRRTGLEGEIVAWADALHEGPVPAVPRSELRRLRAEFLAGCGWGSGDEIAADLERRNRRLTAALADDGPVVLWFEHDLYDQLQLLEVLSLVERPEGVELIVIGEFAGRPRFRGLGELDATELATLWPHRRPLTERALELARRAWDAVRAPDADALRTLLAGDTSDLPYLASALRRLQAELPDPSGLSLSERFLLEALADGPLTPMELHVASQDREEAPFSGDAWTWRRLSELGPLVSAADGSALPPPPPLSDHEAYARVSVALTDAGRRVLAGDADRIELIGVDRWVGGIHVRPGNPARH